MALSLLSIVDRASGEIGLVQPSIVVGSGANQTMQLLALIQKLGLDLVREYDWRQLIRAYRFTTTTALSKTGTTASASAVITGMSNTTSLAAGQVITGTGIAPYAEILTVDSGTQVTMDTPATASGSVTLTFAYQDYALPSGFDRMVPDTNWDRTDHWMNLGPESAQHWQTLTGGIISAGPRERFRLYGNYMRIFPALTTPYNMGYEYISNFWVVASGGTTGTKSAFTADTDTCAFQDDLMLSGLKYYFRRAKGFDFSSDLAEFNDILSTRKGQDEPQGQVSLTARARGDWLGPTIPEGSWSFPSS